MKPGVLSVKAINQYRRRDIIPYLGLRYYLDNFSACRDRWINEISTDLTINRSAPNYLKIFHFKEMQQDGVIGHREMYFPGPNEALAETALLTELSRHNSFLSASYVYSYKFSSPNSKEGVFESYFNGFKDRHKDIAKACWAVEDGLVFYTDIKKFYPNITADLAQQAWDRAIEDSNLSEVFIAVGNKILHDHKLVCEKEGTGKGLLTGPIFSHVIANLILDPIDREMNEITNGCYWRYVDDIVMVGSDRQLDDWRNVLENKLGDMGLELHVGDKDFRLIAEDWLGGENDFESGIGTPWISLIGNIKRFLLANPNMDVRLEKEFLNTDIRIPVKSYAQAVKESSYIQKFNSWRRKYYWSLRAVRTITIPLIMSSAERAMEYYHEALLNLLVEDNKNIESYERKRLIPKLRYYSGRLLFLLDSEGLLAISEKLKEYPELTVLAEVMTAVAIRDVSKVIELGSNATQAAAQILRLSNAPVQCNVDCFNEVNKQSLAVLCLNGVELDIEPPNEPLNKFANGENFRELMSSPDLFIQEIACLHGITVPRHGEMLDMAFDLDEDLAFDVINQLQNSSHG